MRHTCLNKMGVGRSLAQTIGPHINSFTFFVRIAKIYTIKLLRIFYPYNRKRSTLVLLALERKRN
jgi:hypothetical protein